MPFLRERERERERLAAGHQGLGQGNWGSAPAEWVFSSFFFAHLYFADTKDTQNPNSVSIGFYWLSLHFFHLLYRGSTEAL